MKNQDNPRKLMNNQEKPRKTLKTFHFAHKKEKRTIKRQKDIAIYNVNFPIGTISLRETVPLQTSDMGKKTVSVLPH